MRSESKGRIQTVVASLDDPTPARGWAGFEFESLASRLRQHADAVLALAVLHHLVIGRSIPVEQVADFLAELCQTWLVIELIAPDDVKVQALCQARNRADAAEVFSLPRQLSAFARHFDLVESVVLVPEFRHLHLMRRRHDARG